MNLEKILLKVNQYGAMLLLTAPLWVCNGFIFPYVQLKNVFFRLLISALMISLVWFWLEREKKNKQRNYILYALLLFLLVQILAAFFGFNSFKSWWGSWERMDGVINLILLVLYFVLLTAVGQTKRDWLNWLRVSVGVAVAVGCWGLLKNGFNIANNQWSSLGNSAFLGFYMLLNSGLAVIALVMDGKNKWRWYYIFSAGFLWLIMLGASSRAPILGWLVGTLAAAVFYWPAAGKKFRYGLIGGWLFLLLLAGLVVANREASWVKQVHFLDRLVHISSSDSTTHNRILVWQSGWQAFQERPWLGWGPENFNYAINKYYNPQISEEWFDRAHNFIVDYLATSGVIGLAAYLFIWLTAFYLIWRRRRKNYLLASVLAGWAVAYLFTNLFVFDTLNSWLVVMLFLAMVSWLDRGGAADKIGGRLAAVRVKFYYIILLAVSLVSVLTAYFAAVKPAEANYLTGKAYQYSQADPDKALAYYDRAWELKTIGRRELTLQMVKYALSAVRAPETSLKLKDKIFSAAEKKALAFLKSNPHQLQVRMALAELYLAESRYNTFYIDETLKLLQPALKDSPRRTDIYLMLADAESLKHDYKAALKYLEKAYELNPADKVVNDNLLLFYARLNLKDKFIKISREYLKKFKNLTAEDYRKLGGYYFRLGMYRAAENILTEKAIPSEPDNWRSYISLASLYVAEGQKQKAIDFLQQAVKEHPDFKAIVDKYLETIQ